MTAAIVVGLVVLGLVLLAIEILVIPGFGVIGVAGGAAVIAAIYVAFSELSMAAAGLTLVGGLAGTVAILWLFPRTGAGKAMVLETRLGKAVNAALAALVGHEGVALTPLRPAGTVDIGGRPVDVVSDGQYIEPGTRVRVVLVEGSRVVVEPVTREPAA